VYFEERHIFAGFLYWWFAIPWQFAYKLWRYEVLIPLFGLLAARSCDYVITSTCRCDTGDAQPVSKSASSLPFNELE
jgi:hypothetical protein